MNTEEKPKIIDNPNRRALKVWSEKSGKYYYRSRNPDYYNEYFHKTKGPRTCDICGKTATCQLYSHKKSQKCQAKKKELELEATKQELNIIKHDNLEKLD